MTNRAGWVAPAETEPAAPKFIDFLGGPVGKHGRLAESRWFHPVQAIVSVAILILAGGFLTKAPAPGQHQPPIPSNRPGLVR